MPLFGELFLSEILKEPILDPKGEELGRLKDIVVVKAEPLPKVDALIVEVKTVAPEEDEKVVARVTSKYSLVVLPVVDSGGVLLGVVTVDDIPDRILPAGARRK